MSHKATNWAFEQPEKFRDMLPSELVCLLALADCHNPAHGCFPSHEYIANATNLSPRSVRDQLRKLRERGLISWEATRDGNRQGPSRYMLAFEKGFRRQILPPVSGGNESEVQAANSDVFRRQNLPPNPVIENRNKNRNPREGAGEEGNFSFFWEKWDPLHRPENRHFCLVIWQKLSPEAQASAMHALPIYFRFCALRKKPPRMVNYLRDKIFVDLDGAPEFDNEGRFKITPKRPEWSRWLGAIRSKFGERGVASIVKTGYYLTQTRWPLPADIQPAE